MSSASAPVSAKKSSTLPQPVPELLADPNASAKAAGLRYVYDHRPGISRKRQGSGFRYVDADGHPVRDKETLARIKSLAIPPAWTNVWICPSPNGHLQATGRDARGRKQSRYHPRWREVRDEAKYEHMLHFGQALPAIRARVEHDLALPGLPREKVLATVVSLLEATFIRVGNPEYARENHSYGLTTLRRKHVNIKGSTVTFHFKGKSGVEHTIDVSDRRLARIVRTCRDTPGYELFEYLDDDGNPHTIGSVDVNDYLHEITGQHFTAKDFRTWAGTLLACVALREFEACDSPTQLKKNVVQAIASVAKRLGNTPSVCRKCYVHPAVVESYLTGTMTQLAENLAASGARAAESPGSHDSNGSKDSQNSNGKCGAVHALRPDESALMHMLQQQLAQSAA
jgi:DNA topoisomerase-1